MRSTEFIPTPAPWLPFRDMAVLDAIRDGDYEKRAKETFEHPEFKLNVVMDAISYFVTDLFQRIRLSEINNEKLTVVLPSPEVAAYMSLAEVLNKYQVSARNVHVFFLSEYANENNEVAPADSTVSRAYYFNKYCFERIQPDLRMPKDQIHYWTTDNVNQYSNLIDTCGDGGADVIYTSVNWVGGIAGIDPTDDFKADDMETFLTFGSRVTTPLPETISADSMRGMFGCSGDIGAVPPKIATIGPRDIAHAKDRVEVEFTAPVGATTSWQRYGSRMMFFGPITPAIPGTMLRLFKGTAFVDKTIAVPLQYDSDWDPLQENQ